MKKKQHKTGCAVALAAILLLAAAGAVFSHFGGFGAGKSADREAFKKYAKAVADLSVPEETKIVALGEATHGNREFQALKLEVFQVLVERYGVRALALEGDFGGCEAVNRYIHGGGGTARDAVAAIGFAIYRTQEMEDLVSWMRTYNETAPEGQDLRFYGFDMQRYEYNYSYLLEAARDLGLDTAALERLWAGEDYAPDATTEQMAAVYGDIRQKLVNAGEDAAFAVHFADILLQNIELGKRWSDASAEAACLRDQYMAENVLWILAREQARGNRRIFITGHNGHLEQKGSYDAEHKVTGNLLADEIGADAYFAIGTDFCKTRVNLPKKNGGRFVRSFYSHDPLANAANAAGEDRCWLDFSAIPADSPLKAQVTDYCWMGSLGESYTPLMSLLPMSYRIWRSPSELYDGMILVPRATPTEIRD